MNLDGFRITQIQKPVHLYITLPVLWAVKFGFFVVMVFDNLGELGFHAFESAYEEVEDFDKKGSTCDRTANG